jgi:hypothetical protein
VRTNNRWEAIERVPAKTPPRVALRRIAYELSYTEWNSDTIMEIVEILKEAGYVVKEKE